MKGLPCLEQISRHRLHPLLVAMALLSVPSPVPTLAAAETIRVEVDDEQRVTVIGRASSLQMVISDLCIRAGVELAAYNATDRAFRANYERVPLFEVLPRLLRQESHTLRMRTDGNQVRVARLEVIRTTNPDGARPAKSPRTLTPVGGLWLPRSLMESAFASADENLSFVKTSSGLKLLTYRGTE